jgi:O-antigen/teichoic acid export membrane protein
MWSNLITFTIGMKREFLVNLIFLVTINLLIKPFYIFGIDRGVQNLVGPEEFGLYWALFNFVYLFQVINDLGIQNFSNTFISQNRGRAGKYFGHIGMLKIMASAVFTIVVIVFALILGYKDQIWPFIIPLIVNQVLVTFVFFLRANVAGLGHYRLDSVSSVLDKALMILFCGFLLWGPMTIDFTILLFIYCQTASLLLTMIFLAIVLWRRMDNLVFSWSWASILVMLKKSAPFALALILTTLYTRIDSVMIERMLSNGAHEVGVYVSGFRLLEASNMLVYLFIGLLLPMFSYLHNDRSATRDLFLTGFKLIWVVGLTVGLVLAFYRQPIMDLLYTYSEPRWADVMGLLILGFLGMAISHICGALLLANHLVLQCNRIYGIGMVINICLNLYLIPKSGAMGAAYATLITQYFVALATLFLVFRHMDIRFGVGYLSRLLAYAVLVYFSLKIILSTPLFSIWYYDTVFIGLLFAVIALLSGLLPLKQLLRSKS